jgi:hypothetical protein
VNSKQAKSEIKKMFPKFVKGIKFDKGKQDWTLLPWDEVTDIVKVLDYGAKKYTIEKTINEIEFEELINEEVKQCQNADFVIKKYIQSDYVSHAMIKCLKKETQNIKKDKLKMRESGQKNTKKELLNIKNKEKILDIIIPFYDKEINKQNLKDFLKEEDFQLKQIFYYYKNKIINVLSVKENLKNVQSIWIMNVKNKTNDTEKQEDTYVVGATTDLECLEIIFQVLKKRYNILETIQLKNLQNNKILFIKNGRDNWQRVPDAVHRYEAAFFRHMVAFMHGEKNDKESGLPHLAHAGCCLLFLAWFDKNKKAVK